MDDKEYPTPKACPRCGNIRLYVSIVENDITIPAFKCMVCKACWSPMKIMKMGHFVKT